MLGLFFSVFLIILGFFLLAIGIVVFKVRSRLKKLSPLPTASKAAIRAGFGEEIEKMKRERIRKLFP